MTTVTHDIEAVIAKYIKDAIETLAERLKVLTDCIEVSYNSDWPMPWSVEVFREDSNREYEVQSGFNLLDVIAKFKVS